MVTQETARYKLDKLMREFESDPCSLELFLFLKGHPHTLVSHSVLLSLSNAPRIETERAIAHLREIGLVKSQTKDGTSFYFLNNDKKITGPLLHLLNC